MKLEYQRGKKTRFTRGSWYVNDVRYPPTGAQTGEQIEGDNQNELFT